MERVPLVTGEKTFCLRSDSHPERCVLVIDPRLRVPTDGWKERTEAVSILRPDGGEFEAAAQISLSHLNIKMEARDLSTDQRWSVTILFQGLTSDDVPNGSKILVSQETRDALLPNAVV